MNRLPVHRNPFVITVLALALFVLGLAACAPVRPVEGGTAPAAPLVELPQIDLPPAPDFSAEECNNLLSLASDFVRADDYAGVVQLIDIVLGCSQSDDVKAGVLFLRAEANMQLGDWQAAIDDYRQALALGLESADAAGARNNICWFYALNDQAELALPYCEQAVAANPSASYLDSRGLAYALSGQTEAAVADFEAALAEWSAAADPQIQAIAAQRQAWVDALRAGESPITPAVLAALRAEDAPGVQPALASAASQAATEHFLLGRHAHMLGQFEQAVVEYTQAIELDPDYWPAYFYRGTVHMWQEEWDAALADMQATIALNPQQAFAQHYSGLMYTRLEQVDEAIAAYSRAIALQPDEMSFYADRAAAYFAQQDFAAALTDLDTVLRSQPDSPTILFMRGAAHRALQHRGQAISDLERALELGLPAALQQQAEAALKQLREGFF